jgi:hypothetical protein
MSYNNFLNGKKVYNIFYVIKFDWLIKLKNLKVFLLYRVNNLLNI